jgi:putative membrane protein
MAENSSNSRLLTNSRSHYLFLFLKGIAMGLGDSIPGVSGATIAVITNIYERLILAIRSIDSIALKLFGAREIAKAWQHIDGNFLIVVAVGALTGLLLSANTVLYLLDNFPEPLMAFFVGLVLASIWVLRSQYKIRSARNLLAIFAGTALAVMIGSLEPRVAEISILYVFICGAIGISAMILPGLSGAFILLLLGIYEYILTALVGFELLIILVFFSGCVIGLLLFSRALAWLLQHYHELSFAIISGLLCGSVYVLWPWQQTVSFYTDTSGMQHVLQTVNIWPLNYTEITGNSAWLALSVVTFLSGLGIVLALQIISNKKTTDNV